MANPLIYQGVLNRAFTAVSVIDYPYLNVTTGYFGTKVARINFNGDTSDYIATLSGAVPSPRLVQFVEVTMYLNKSQYLADQWEQQRQTNSQIGDVNIVTDSPVLAPYYLYNCILRNIPDLDLTGDSNDFPISLMGTLPVNADLFG